MFTFTTDIALNELLHIVRFFFVHFRNNTFKSVFFLSFHFNSINFVFSSYKHEIMKLFYTVLET